jgi:UDP-glucose 4-epimerase
VDELLRVGAAALVLESAVDDFDLLGSGAADRVLDGVRPEVVLHLAWVASGTPGYRNHPDNPDWARATVELARACRARGIWFIGTGTVAELEEHPADAYTRAKARTFHSLGPDIEGGSLTWLRPHYVFDPDLGRPEVMGEIRRAIVEDRTPDLRSPESAHDFVHVRDVAAAVRAVLASELRGLVPIGSGRNHSVAQLAAAAGASGVQAQRLPQAVDRFTADTSRLEAVGWSAEWTKGYFHG